MSAGEVVELRSGSLALVVAPAAGGEIRSLRSLRSGRELLFQAPWEREAVARGDDGDDWVRGWGGGWQVLFPNAGEISEHRGRRHPYHGDAALGSFAVAARSDAHVALGWADASGLGLRRTIAVDGAVVRVDTEIRNEGGTAAPYALVEHLILGGDLVSPGTRIGAAGRLWALADDGRPLGERARAPWWPHAGGEDWSLVPEAAAGRFGCLIGGPPAADVASPAGLRARVRWDARAFPHLWYWLEWGQARRPPWNGRTRCLGVEPSSVATGDGLAARAAAGEARVLAPGERAAAWIEVEVGDAG